MKKLLDEILERERLFYDKWIAARHIDDKCTVVDRYYSMFRNIYEPIFNFDAKIGVIVKNEKISSKDIKEITKELDHCNKIIKRNENELTRMGQLQSQIYTKNNSLIRKELDSMLNHSDSDRTEHSNAKCLKEFFIEIQTRAQDAIKMKILVTQLGGHVKDKREYRNLIQNTWEKKRKIA